MTANKKIITNKPVNNETKNEDDNFLAQFTDATPQWAQR